MRKILLIQICLFLATNCMAQNTDTCLNAHLQYLYCKSKRYCSENKDSVYHRELINQYLELIAKYKSNLDGEPYNQLGKEYFYINKYDSALLYYKMASNFVDTVGAYHNNIGTIYFLNNDYENSYRYFKIAFQKDSTIQDYMNNLASYFGAIGNYTESIKWSKKSLKIGKSQSANLVALNSLAISYRFLKKRREEEKYLNFYDMELEKYYEPKQSDNCDCVKTNCNY